MTDTWIADADGLYHPGDYNTASCSGCRAL